LANKQLFCSLLTGASAATLGASAYYLYSL